MKKTDDRKITDTLLRCARGGTYMDCAKGCAYAVRGRDCQAAIMRDAASLIKHLLLTIAALSKKISALESSKEESTDGQT